MTQSQLAAVLGKSEGAVRAWEIDRSKPDADTLITLADYFKCTTDYLLGRSDYRNENERSELEELFDELNKMIVRIPNGDKLLNNYLGFLNLIDEKYYEMIVTDYISALMAFNEAFREAYKLHEEFKIAREFNFLRFLECELNLSATRKEMIRNINTISSNPINLLFDNALDYGSDKMDLVYKIINSYNDDNAKK